MIYENIAVRLQITPEELERESLRVFLTHRLHLIESQLLDFTSKYGVKTIIEMDRLVQSGQIHEVQAFEDYFIFDHLEAERDLTMEALGELDK